MRGLSWGATAAERRAAMPGDELLAARVTTTSAISVAAAPAAVWPWLVQIGADRGGFYSHQRLENLIGCGIRNAERIHPEWQDLREGDTVALHPRVALDVARVDAERALVLVAPPPGSFSWAFALAPAAGGARLVVRERYDWPRPLAVGMAAGSAVMSRAMLRGIRRRAER